MALQLPCLQKIGGILAPRGGAFSGVNGWVTVTLLEGVWACPTAACGGPAPCVFLEV